ncbi:hypothetical protein D3C78_1242180 [compost metagenome]
MSEEPSEHLFSIRGIIATREMLGAETIYQVRSGKQSYMIKCTEDLFTVDQEVYVGVPQDKLSFFGPDERRIEQQDGSYRDYMEALRGQRHG